MEQRTEPFYAILPFPPSINHYWKLIPMGNKARMIVGKRGKEFREEVKTIVGNVTCKLSNLAVKLIVYPPDNRRRDIDNLLKATLDALQYAGVYKDDCLIDKINITRVHNPEAKLKDSIFVHIEEI